MSISCKASCSLSVISEGFDEMQEGVSVDGKVTSMFLARIAEFHSCAIKSSKQRTRTVVPSFADAIPAKTCAPASLPHMSSLGVGVVFLPP